MICKHGREEVPPGEKGRYFICKFGSRAGQICKWATWNYGLKEYVTSSHPNGAICQDQELVKEIQEIEELPEPKPIIKTRKPKSTSRKPVTKKITSVKTSKPCGCKDK